MASKHDKIAMRIAQRKGVRYNRGQGPDVVTATQAIEVETADSARDGLRQLRGFRKAAYILGVDQDAVDAALQATNGTTVGVMGPDGAIVKRSTRRQ